MRVRFGSTVRLRRALALTSVALKFEMVFEVGSLDAPLTELNFTHMGRILLSVVSESEECWYLGRYLE